MLRTVAHVSDLHVGRDRATDEAADRLCGALLAAGVDQVLVTGDVTHRGRLPELARFRRAFDPLLRAGRVIVVPGNHDRMGDDVAEAWMQRRVDTCARPGLHVVRIDSTAPHNSSLMTPQGVLTRDDVRAAQTALDAAPPDALRVLMLHHHLVPLPHDCVYEQVSSLLGWRGAEELGLGRLLVSHVAGSCDLVLHGHRHDEGEVRAAGGLRVINAGSSTALERARVLLHAGRTVVAERWVEAGRAAVATAQRAAAAA